MDVDDDPDLREQIFNNTVREKVIFLLVFLLLNILSYILIEKFKRKDLEDYLSTDDEEATVYTVSVCLCSVSLSVSLGAALLLPFSIASNEILNLYPNSFYIQWLNHSLVQGLWNNVFLFSNVSMFILLPFSYLFTESEGLYCRKGFKARLTETLLVLGLLFLVILGISHILSTQFSRKDSSLNYLPFLYSCLSFVGVHMLLVCTPFGVIKLFEVMSDVLVKPGFLRDLNEEFWVALLEENCVSRRLTRAKATGKSYLQPAPMMLLKHTDEIHDESELLHLVNGALQSGLGEKLTQVRKKKDILDLQRQSSPLQRNLVYPAAMVLLLALTLVTVLLVVSNSLGLLIGINALPLSTQQFTLGLSSISALGTLGAGVQTIIILYLIVVSTIGFYSLPKLRWLRPRPKQTPLTYIIANCYCLLLLTSALPVLARMLGVTNFDLLGDFGQIEWLGNFSLVFTYNLIFASATTLSIVRKFTSAVRKELITRLHNGWCMLFDRDTYYKPKIPSYSTPQRVHRTSSLDKDK